MNGNLQFVIGQKGEAVQRAPGNTRELQFMNSKYSKKQIDILREYYPIGDWDSIIPYFPNMKRVNIRALARRYGIKQDKREFTSQKDITGQRFGKLTAVQFVEYKKQTPYWLCKCDCGNETILSVYSLLKGETKSCGCLRHKPAINAIDLTGQKFGLLTAVERIPNYRGRGTTYYRCECECGKTDVFVSSGNLKSGHTLSCGTHNHKRIEYKALKNLDDREHNYMVYRHIAPNGKSYIGITKQDAERRFQDGNGYKTQKVFWRAIVKYGWDNFQHEILAENLTEKEASEKEALYILEFNAFAPNGYNIAEGGVTGRKRVKPIIQYYKGKPVNLFLSSREASKILEIAEQTIKTHCDDNHAVGDYYFAQLPFMYTYEIPQKYLGLHDETHLQIKDIVAKELQKTTISRNLAGGKPINKYELSGKYICTFPSIASAKASIDGCDGEAISAAVNPNRQGDTAYGFLWRYDSGNHSDIAPHRYKVQRAVQQIDIETGAIINEYKSMSEAARAFNSYPKYIAQVCRGERASWQGYKWRIKQ